MQLGKYIKSVIEIQGRTIVWVSKQLGMNERTFAGKLNRDSISGEDLIRISHLLGFNLEKLKEEMINMSIAAAINEMKEICEEFGYELNQLQNINFIVTDKCKPMIVKFQTADLRKQTGILKMNGIVPAVRYSGNYLTGIATTYRTTDIKDHKFFDQYLANATVVNKTTKECVRKIIQDSENQIISI